MPDALQGLEFLDTFHEYPDVYGNVRYYHKLKAALCRQFIMQYAGKEKTFLDAGAGRGPYTFLASGKYKTLYCYEYDASELSHARTNLSTAPNNIEYELVDLTCIPLAGESIDVAICSEVLEHIPDYDKAAQELFRVLKPGGMLLLSMPNSGSIFYTRVWLKHRSLRDKAELSHSEWELLRHVSFNVRAIERIAKGAGFTICRRDSANILPISAKFRKRLWLGWPRLFRIYAWLDIWLANLFPRVGAFYFLVLKK